MRLLSALTVLLLLLGCNRRPNLVGQWQSGLGGALTHYTFEKDGTFTIDVLSMGYHCVSKGRYHVEGGRLFLDPSDATVEGAGPDRDAIRNQLLQQSRLTMKVISPMSIQLGLQEPPLVINRMGPP